MFEVGTQPWADALRDAVNADPRLSVAARGWSVRLGLAFESKGEPAAQVALDIEDGRCVDAHAEADAFRSADLRISGPCEMWATLFEGGAEPIRSILTHRLRVDGNQLLLVRAMPAAKALIEAARRLDGGFAALAS